MNAPALRSNLETSAPDAPVAPDAAEEARFAALNLFELEEFQNLSSENLRLAQSVAGHGEQLGVWKTPLSIAPGRFGSRFRTIDLAKRLRDFLAKEPVQHTSTEVLVQEGALLLTRLGLLMRLAPTGGRRSSKTERLKPTTLAQRLYTQCPQVFARAIRRKAERTEALGLLACLTQEDLMEMAQAKSLRIELDRILTLTAMGLWSDVPPQPDITFTTDPRGSKPSKAPEAVAGEYRPIPDEYLIEIGPRVLWLIRELGPRLIPLLEDLAAVLEALDWSEMTNSKLVGDYGIVNKFIEEHLRAHPWADRTGKMLRPTFPLMTGAKATDRFEWPPRTYEHIKVLSVTLQSAHLFITLLACAGRIGEVEGLSRSCVKTARDGKDYVFGWTYKLSGNLFGDARQWPAPPVMTQSLGQQARLAEAWSRLPPRAIDRGLPTEPPTHGALWLSLGVGGAADASDPLSLSHTSLPNLAIRVGMDPKPGGINLHPHRFRKTIGRIAGVTLFNSPLVLKRLFGHKSIEMTLRYILCDNDIRAEAETVLRELRILHCAEALEEVREALVRGEPLPGHGGAAAGQLIDAVKDHEARLAESGRVWAEGTAYDLAYLLTANGQGWRFVQKNIVCTKVPGEDSPCRKKRKRGEPNTSNCKPDCDNRIVLAIQRRDAREVLGAYLDVARQARDEEQYLVFYESMQRFIEELDTFPDIRAQYVADPDVDSLLSTYRTLSQ